MRGNLRQVFLNFLIMLAVIGAGISPACKFISGGQTWLEICGAEGIKKILIASDEAPQGQDQEQDHANADPCAFCFTQASVKIISAAPVEITLPIMLTSVIVPGELDDHPVFRGTTNLSARGPPILL